MIVMLGACGVAHADEAAARGKQVVEQWCRMCHLHATDAADPDMAPPFEDVVKREGRDRAYFVRFMKDDHFPMTTFRLFDHEKADVVAYLMALQRQGASRP
jgi:mono/diheme cytochrome c family protein